KYLLAFGCIAHATFSRGTRAEHFVPTAPPKPQEDSWHIQFTTSASPRRLENTATPSRPPLGECFSFQERRGSDQTDNCRALSQSKPTSPGKMFLLSCRKQTWVPSIS